MISTIKKHEPYTITIITSLLPVNKYQQFQLQPRSTSTYYLPGWNPISENENLSNECQPQSIQLKTQSYNLHHSCSDINTFAQNINQNPPVPLD